MVSITRETLTPIPLMQLATGFWAAKVLAAAVELDLAGRLAGGRSATPAELAGELGLPPRPAGIFLSACASVGLLEKVGEEYRNSALAERFLVPGAEHYFGGLVTFMDHREYPAWHRLTEALREDRPLTWNPATQESLFAAEDPVMMRLFWGAMHSMSTYTATALASAHDFSIYQRLLDVGGGSGAFPIRLCQRYANLTATVFDLPHVRDIAAARIAEAGLDGVIDVVVGDFRSDDPLPSGYDVILLSNILHDWDDGTCRRLLGKCWRALPPGGALVVSELMLNPERTGPADAALMGLNMLVETEGGRNYTETELTSWLTEAGFGDVHVVPFSAPGANGAAVGRKPGA